MDASMTRYQLLGVTRRSQKNTADDVRNSRLIGGPDAVLAGQLRVKNQQAFAQLLAHGIGRHRAFGFGLLLLRPARG